MQVFYVNIGGGEPHGPARLLGARRLRDRAPRRRQVLDQRSRITPERGRAARAPPTTSTCRSRSTARRAEVNDAVRGAGSLSTTAIAAMEQPRRGRLRRLQAVGRRHPPERRAARRVQGDRRSLRRAAAADAAASVGSRRRRVGRAAPDRRAAARAVRLAARARRGRAHRRLASSTSARYGEPLPGPQPVRRRPGRLPDRPDRRRVRVPVRDPRRVPGRQRPRRRRLRRTSGASRSCSPSCAGPRPAAPARSCGHLRQLPRRLHGGEVLHRAAARRARPRVRARPRRARCWRRAAPRPIPRPRSITRAAPTRPARACDESPLAVMERRERCWFESVAEAQRRAKRTAAALGVQGAARRLRGGLTLADNLAAFGELGFAPHVGGPPAERDLAHDGDGPGDLAAGADLADRRAGGAPRRRGRGGARRGRARHRDRPELVRHPSRSRRSSAANPQTFFQIYWCGSREQIAARLERAQAAGARRADRHARLDVLARPRLGQPDDPRADRPQDDGPARARGAHPPAVVRWRWTRAGGPPDLTVPNMAGRGAPAPTFFGAYGEWMMTPPPSWEDLRWLREQWDGPFMLKGVMRVDDARRARRRRRHRDLGLQPRRQQPRRHPGLDPRAAGGRRGGRRPDRGPARRRRSAAAPTSSRRSPSARAR